MRFIEPNSDASVTWSSCKNAITDSFLNSATVTVSIKTASGTEVVSSQSVAYVTGSDGNYRATLDKALFSSMTQGLIYVLELYVTDSATGLDRTVKMNVKYDYDPVI